MEKDQPPSQSLSLLKFPSKRHRVNKCVTYISTSQTRDHHTMSNESYMNVSGTPLTPTSTIVSRVPSTPASLMVCIPENPLLNTSQPVVSTHPMRTNPFVFLGDSLNHNTHSIPWASNPFSLCMTNMTSHLSSSISMSNVNPSFESWGTMPPYTPFSFHGGHIPQPIRMIEGWNPPSSRPNPSFNFPWWTAQMGG